MKSLFTGGNGIRNLLKTDGTLSDSQIILTTTILMHDKNWDTSIEEVCRRIDSSRVHHFMYQKNGSGTPGHIRIPEAEEMAEELSAYINSLGDIWR